MGWLVAAAYYGLRFLGFLAAWLVFLYLLLRLSGLAVLWWRR